MICFGKIINTNLRPLILYLLSFNKFLINFSLHNNHLNFVCIMKNSQWLGCNRKTGFKDIRITYHIASELVVKEMIGNMSW